MQFHRETIPAALKFIRAGKQYGSFQDHKRRMQYQAFWQVGAPIGSRSVESAVKQHKPQLTGAGMRWSRPAAGCMMIFWAAVLSGTDERQGRLISRPAPLRVQPSVQLFVQLSVLRTAATTLRLRQPALWSW